MGEIWQAHSDYRFDPHGAASGFRWSARGPADDTGEDGFPTVLRGSPDPARTRAHLDHALTAHRKREEKQ
ncbi:hypothetical protein ACFSVJ_05395 [Prauserella oleivorans]